MNQYMLILHDETERIADVSPPRRLPDAGYRPPVSQDRR